MRRVRFPVLIPEWFLIYNSIYVYMSLTLELRIIIYQLYFGNLQMMYIKLKKRDYFYLCRAGGTRTPKIQILSLTRTANFATAPKNQLDL